MSHETFKTRNGRNAYTESRPAPAPDCDAERSKEYMAPFALIKDHSAVLTDMKVGSASVPVNLKVIKSPFMSAADASK